MANENNASATKTSTASKLAQRREEIAQRRRKALVELHIPGENVQYLEDFAMTIKRESSRVPYIEENTSMYIESLMATTAAKRAVDELLLSDFPFGFISIRKAFRDAIGDACKHINSVFVTMPIIITDVMAYEELTSLRDILFAMQCHIRDLLSDTISDQIAKVGDYYVPYSDLISIIGGKDCTLRNNDLEIEVQFQPYDIMEATEIKSRICSFYEAVKRTVADNA